MSQTTTAVQVFSISSTASPSSVLDPSSSSSSTQAPRFLACLRCRTKKAKCDNGRPSCTTCLKVGAECIRPISRRRKRTRKEMEQAEREQAEREGREWIPRPKEARAKRRTSDDLRNELSLNTDVHPNIQAHPEQYFLSQSSQPLESTSHHASSRTGQNTNYASTERQTLPYHPKGSPPKQDDPGEVVESLSKRVAFLEGDPRESQVLKVHYYRLSGCTAIHPGYNRIVITLQRPPSHKTSITHLLTPESPASPILSSAPEIDLDTPPLDKQMLDVFFSHFGEHFPFLKRLKVEERLAMQEGSGSGEMSAFLGFAMCALAARFIPKHNVPPSQYISAAWKLALPLLRLPSTDVVAGLLMLSWAEFGENSESGLWNFSGLAMRMALDLGLHKSNPEEPDDVCDGKLLWWSLFIMDRILAFGTGRSPTLPQEQIEIPLPTDSDFGPGEYPFVKIVGLFALAGQIANCMNTTTSSSPYETQELERLHDQLVQFIAGLSSSERMMWSVDNFRKMTAAGCGGSFLFLHLWSNAVLALIHHPNLGLELPRAHFTTQGASPNGLSPPTLNSSHSPQSSVGSPHSSLHSQPPALKRSIKLSLASSRQIADCLVFADLFDDKSYCANPFVNQCLFIAGVAFVYDASRDGLWDTYNHDSSTIGMTSSSTLGTGTGLVAGAGTGARAFMCGLVRQNLSSVLRGLRKMEGYWSGLGYIISVLEQRASGRGWERVDLAESDDHGLDLKGRRFISLPDMGLLRKLTRRKEGQGHGLSQSPSTLTAPTTTTAAARLQNEAVSTSEYRYPTPNGKSNDWAGVVQEKEKVSVSHSQLAEYDQNWSFESLLGTYQVHEVTASGAPSSFDFSTVFPEGFSW